MEYKNFTTRLKNLEKEITQAIHDLLSESGHNNPEGLRLNNTVSVKAQNDFNWGEDGVIHMEATSVRTVEETGAVFVDVTDNSTDNPDWIGVRDLDSLNYLYQEVYQTLDND